MCTSRDPYVHPGTIAVNQTACNFTIKGIAFTIALHLKSGMPTVNISNRKYKISKIVYNILDLRKALSFHLKFYLQSTVQHKVAVMFISNFADFSDKDK